MDTNGEPGQYDYNGDLVGESERLRPVVNVTATVRPGAPGSGTPTGSVTFFDGSTELGEVTSNGGIASLQQHV